MSREELILKEIEAVVDLDPQSQIARLLAYDNIKAILERKENDNYLDN